LLAAPRRIGASRRRKSEPAGPNPLPVLFVAAAFVLSLSAIMISGAPVGSEFQVNTFYTGYQDSPSVAMDPNGNFVVAWGSSNQDGSGYGVYAQRFDGAGNELGPEFLVNTQITDDQKAPSVASDSDGDFVVVWQSWSTVSSYDICMQAFGSSGNPVGLERRVNTISANEQQDPAIAMAPDGRSIVVWTSTDQDGSYDGIFGQFFDSSGAPSGSEFRVNTYTLNYQDYPAVAMDSSGKSVVVWRSVNQDGSGGGIYAQRYGSNGNAVGDEFRVNTNVTNHQVRPSVAMDSDGDFVVVWASNLQDGSQYGIYGQRFASDGTPIGSEFQVNTYISGNQQYPCVAANSTGAFAVIWTSDGQDGSLIGIYGQKYDNTGDRFEEEFQVNTYTTNDQTSPSIAMSGQGDFVVVWQSDGQDGDGWGIYGQLYDTAPIPEFLTLIIPIAGSIAIFLLIRRKRL